MSRHRLERPSRSTLRGRGRRPVVLLLTASVVLTGGAAFASQRWSSPLPRLGADGGGTVAEAVVVDPGTTLEPSPGATRPPERTPAPTPPLAATPPVAPGPTVPGVHLERKPRRAPLAGDAETLARTYGPVGHGPTTSFRLATVNVLGDSHTRAGGNKRGYDTGATRMRELVGILESQDLDVIALQELEQPQKVAFRRSAPGWSLFTGSARGRDSIAFRDDVWEQVRGGTGTIPYFHGNPVPMPWVTLRHRATGREVSVLSIHNPTSNPRRGNNAGARAEATRREVAMVRTLAEGGNPVLLLGDFNERSEAFCAVTALGDIVAANGGSNGAGCAPPAHAGIDWIFGTADIDFSDYARHEQARLRRVTDHPVIVARATISEAIPGSR